ncbi:hypothetical protein D3C77_343390 [compost metagenome]
MIYVDQISELLNGLGRLRLIQFKRRSLRIDPLSPVTEHEIADRLAPCLEHHAILRNIIFVKSRMQRISSLMIQRQFLSRFNAPGIVIGLLVP